MFSITVFLMKSFNTVFLMESLKCLFSHEVFLLQSSHVVVQLQVFSQSCSITGFLMKFKYRFSHEVFQLQVFSRSSITGFLMKSLIRDFLVKSLNYRHSHEKVSEYDQ